MTGARGRGAGTPQNFIIFKKALAKPTAICYYMWAERNTVHFRVWRSLVSRLNGVQEAASSNLVTRTNTGYQFSILCVFFSFFAAKNQRALGREAPFDPPPACRTQSASHWFESSHWTNAEYRFSILCVFFVLCRKELAGSWARSAVLSAAALSAPSVLPLYARPDRRCCRQSIRYGIQLLQQI